MHHRGKVAPRIGKHLFGFDAERKRRGVQDCQGRRDALRQGFCQGKIRRHGAQRCFHALRTTGPRLHDGRDLHQRRKVI